MKKKTLFFLILIALSVFLVGFASENVTLFHKNKVIDLSKAVELSKPGGDEGEKNDTTAEDEPSTVTPIEIEETTEIDDLEDKQSTINIIVECKNIKIDSVEISSVDEAEKKLKELYRPDVEFELIDTYAEAHVYKKMISVLEKLHSEIGLIYAVQQ